MVMARKPARLRMLALVAVLLGVLLTAASALASDGRIGALLNNNELWSKDGNYGAQWTQIATGAKSFSMAGNRIGYLTTAGVAYGKEGDSLTSPWTNIGPAGQKSLVVGAYPPRTMIVNPADDLYVQEGPYATAPGGVYLAGRVGPIAAADGRLAFANTDSTAMRTEEGPLSGANWNFQLFGSTEIALSGHRIVTLLNNGQLWAKQGTQSDQWYLLRTGVAHIAASGTRVAAIDIDGKLYVMDKATISSVTSSDWWYEVTGATDVALDNDRIGVVLNNGELWIKEGGLGDQWIFELNGAVRVRLAHRDVTGPTLSASGSLHDAPNPLTDGSLGINVADVDSGAAGYKLTDSTGAVLAQQTRAFNDCAASWCAGQPLQSSATINPIALGWATGAHHLVLDAWDFAGNHTTQSWDVTYYATSWAYGGGNHAVDNDPEANALIAALSANDGSGAQALLDGLGPDENAWLKNTYLIPMLPGGPSPSGPQDPASDATAPVDPSQGTTASTNLPCQKEQNFRVGSRDASHNQARVQLRWDMKYCSATDGTIHHVATIFQGSSVAGGWKKSGSLQTGGGWEGGDHYAYRHVMSQAFELCGGSNAGVNVAGTGVTQGSNGCDTVTVTIDRTVFFGRLWHPNVDDSAVHGFEDTSDPVGPCSGGSCRS